MNATLTKLHGGLASLAVASALAIAGGGLTATSVNADPILVNVMDNGNFVDNDSLDHDKLMLSIFFDNDLPVWLTIGIDPDEFDDLIDDELYFAAELTNGTFDDWTDMTISLGGGAEFAFIGDVYPDASVGGDDENAFITFDLPEEIGADIGAPFAGPSGFDWKIDLADILFDGDLGLYMFDIHFNPTLPANDVPEPAGLSFLALGLLGMGIARRRARKA